MGMDRKVAFAPGTVPDWARLAGFFAARQFPIKTMMIDGELSFPDDQPPCTWRELRLGTPLGMVTLRREDDAVRVVTLGNAQGPLLHAWNALTWGLAAVFGGAIHDGDEMVSAEEFTQRAELPEGLVSAGQREQ
jgi:hypothetical protein